MSRLRNAHLDGGKLFLLFIVSLAFVFARLIRARPASGGASIGSVHLHHVPGLVVALAAGHLAFAQGTGPPGSCSRSPGAGAALVLGSALIFHLEDVYWSDEGRSSVDAVIVGTILAGILLHTASPFGVESENQGPRTAVFAVLALNYLWSLVCFFKGKPVIGAVGLLISFVAFIGAIRLAKPDSPWSRWRYAKSPRKLERARHRYGVGWQGRLERKIADIIGGAPSGGPPAAGTRLTLNLDARYRDQPPPSSRSAPALPLPS
jgi:hypothetical protein